MEQFSKDIVKQLINRKVEKVSKEKDEIISQLKKEIEVIKLDKQLDLEYNKPQQETKTIDTTEIDKILGGLDD